VAREGQRQTRGSEDEEDRIQFNADDLINALEEARDHVSGQRNLTMRKRRVRLPDPAPEVEPKEIAAMRRAFNVTQPVFARLLSVPTVTAVSWEKGRRKPSGAALRLLQVARKHPKALTEA
jgi:putative transcriptional regulator